MGSKGRDLCPLAPIFGGVQILDTKIFNHFDPFLPNFDLTFFRVT